MVRYLWVPQIATGMDEEGLFRQSGSLQQLLEIKDMFDSGISVYQHIHPRVGVDAKVDLKSLKPSPHAIASLLKLYVRVLPESLIPFELFHDFVVINGTK